MILNNPLPTFQLNSKYEFDYNIVPGYDVYRSVLNIMGVIDVIQMANEPFKHASVWQAIKYYLCGVLKCAYDDMTIKVFNKMDFNTIPFQEGRVMMNGEQIITLYVRENGSLTF